MKKKRLGFIAAVLLLAAFAMCSSSFGQLTCTNSQADIESFLEEWNRQEITVLKSARSGRIKAVLYENEAGQLGVNVFERKLLGLRLKHDGMNLCDKESGLHISGSWTKSSLRGSKCDIVVFGDNRGGEVDSYILWDVKDITRGDLEADYILDVYVPDGIAALPKGLQQRDADGKILDFDS